MRTTASPSLSPPLRFSVSSGEKASTSPSAPTKPPVSVIDRMRQGKDYPWGDTGGFFFGGGGLCFLDLFFRLDLFCNQRPV